MTLPRAEAEATNMAALAIKTGWLAIAGSRGLTPGRKIRGVGRKGASWNVRYDVKGTVNATALIRFTGPVHLVMHPTKAHMIVPRGKGKTRRAQGVTFLRGLSGGGSLGRGALAGAGRHAVVVNGNPRAYSQTPGTKGKSDIWPACRAFAATTGPKQYQVAIPGALVRAGFGR